MMDFNAIYARTEKGETEIGKNSQFFALDLVDVFALVDGKSTVGEMIEKAPHWTAEAIGQALDSLLEDGLIRRAEAGATDLTLEPLDEPIAFEPLHADIALEPLQMDIALEPMQEPAAPDAPHSEAEVAFSADDSHTALEAVQGEASAPEGSKFADSKRNVIATVLFLDIVEYTKQSVSNQLAIKEQFNTLVSDLIRNIPEDDRVILDTGDGAALGFLGDPEDVLFIAINLRDALKRNDHKDFPDLYVRMGINLGPVRLVKDMTGKSNLIGDGVNDAQRVMSFARADQILVSRSFYDVVSRLSADHSGLFKYQGVHRDKHRREHEIYEIGSPEMQAEREAEAKAAAKTEEEIQAERREKLKAKLEAAARAEASAKAAADNAEVKAEMRKQAEMRSAKRQEERVAASKASRARANLVKPLLAVSVVALALVAALPLIPLKMYAPGAEQFISDKIREPATVGSLSVALLPSPQVVLKDVAVGQELRIKTLAAGMTLGSLLSDAKTITSLKIDDVSLNQETLSKLGQWAAGAGAIPKIELGNVKLSIRETPLPAFDAVLEMAGEGGVQHATVSTADKKMSAEVAAKGGEYQVSLSAKAWPLPLGPATQWEELRATGMATSQGMKLSEIDAAGYGGSLKGALQVSWARGWHVEGTFYGKGLELDQLAPVFSSAAKLKGALETRGSYALDAKRFEQLFDSPRIKAAFAVRDGAIDNVDIAAAISPGSGAGLTKIGELSGVVGVSGRQYQFQQLKLSSGLLKADGYYDVAADQRVSGRINVELGPLRSSLAISGTVAEPQLRR